MLVFLAHILGPCKAHFAKEVSHSKTNTIISMVLLNSLVAVFILYLEMRQAFVSINNSQGLSLEGVFDTGEIDGLEGVIGELDDGCSYIHQLGWEGFFLLLVNIVAYVAGVSSHAAA